MIIGFLFGVTAEDMLEGIHKPTVPVYEMQDAADLDLLQLVEKRMIQQFTLTGITQRPARVTATSNDRKVPILTSGDSPVNLSDTALKLFFQFREMLPNRLLEQAQTRLGNQLFFVFPLVVINQVVFEAAEAHAVPAEDIASFETLA